MKGIIFTYLLAYGGPVVALFNPFYGFLAYVCLAVVRPNAMWHWAGLGFVGYSRYLAICILLGWAFHGFGRWKMNNAKGIGIALLGFWIWSVLSALNAYNGDVAWNFVYVVGKIILPVLVALTLIDSIHKLKLLAWVLLLSQGYVAFEMNISYYQGYNRMYTGLGGYDNNMMAITMVAGIGISIFLGFASEKSWQRILAWGAGLLMAHSVMLSYSRGGLLALICLVLASFFLLPRKTPKHILIFIILLAIGFRLAGPSVVDRFMTSFADSEGRDPSATSRLELWKDNWDAMLKHPILGVGPDHWALISHQYGWPPGKEGHSLWLQIGAELGIPGLAFLLLFYWLCLLRLLRLIYKKNVEYDPWIGHVGRMVIASNIGFILAAQFVSVEALEIPYFVNILGAGALKLMPVNLTQRATIRDTPIFERENPLAMSKI